MNATEQDRNRWDRARAVKPGEIECCGVCTTARQRGCRMTLLGWQDYHANRHFGARFTTP